MRRETRKLPNDFLALSSPPSDKNKNVHQAHGSKILNKIACLIKHMVDYNIVIDEEIQENLQLDAQIKSTKQQKLDDEAAGKEWASLYGLGVCWDVATYAFFFISQLHDVSIQQIPDHIQNAFSATSFAQGFVLLILMALQLLFMHRFGAPGSFMSQYLKLYVTKSVSGKLLYLTIVLISILTSRQLRDYIKAEGDPAKQNSSIFCLLLACVYHLFFHTMFLAVHGPTAIVVFPIKFLIDHRHPPHESTTVYNLKLCSLLTIVIWIYIAASYEDKKYNHTAEVLAGDSEGNLMAKDVIMVTHMIIFPIMKIFAFIVVTLCAWTIVVECFLMPAIQLARRNRLVLPRNELHFE